jgi:hypothetical protein
MCCDKITALMNLHLKIERFEIDFDVNYFGRRNPPLNKDNKNKIREISVMAEAIKFIC